MNRFGTTDIKYLKGVGPERAKVLASEFGIRTFRDLLYYFPFRYTDRSRYFAISELQENMPSVQIRGSFVRFSEEGEGARRRLCGTFTDGHRMLETVWFSHIDRIRAGLRIGKPYVIFGKPNFYRGIFSMSHPEIEEFDSTKPREGLRGHYSVTEKSQKRMVTSRTFSTLTRNLLDHKDYGNITETLPREIVERYHLMPLAEALENMHFPRNNDALQRARERMKMEELYYIEMHILRFSRERGVFVKGPVLRHVGKKFNKFYSEVIPFPLTGAQKRVIREIRADVLTGRQMNRLVQGDVGCGKTLVAFMSMLIAVDNGYQASLMAPTEILATQHYENLKQWGDAIGVEVRLLTGSTRQSERREIAAGLADGSIKILIGTHALIEDTVQFSNLGMAVIDEQHRFGVAQRARMWKKSALAPHVLVMTATPIPRTLAMTVYGDLDVSVIDELPPGRKPVTTLVRYDNNRESVDRLLGIELEAGRQIYMVYPLVHENDKLELKSVEQGFEMACDKFGRYGVCLVHGQLKPDEKDRQMELFVSGKARVMVATTVIEVGVNVPNASVMVIENAERFGLAQLHQLRGRVGRGADKSFCILMTHPKTASDTRKRLNIMEQTTDGFLISEADMNIRGPGDMEGTQQSGLAFNLRVASLATDGQLVARAREAANLTLDAEPSLLRGGIAARKHGEPFSTASLEIIRREMALRFESQYDWSLIS